jgi:energy-coupling factor transporter ATP-binding protein EcfA2
MIKQLNITNFRCYEQSTINFNGTSILVGKNNAGKSTLIEALKIISSVTRKYKSLRFIAPPEWLDDEVSYGVSPNVENMNISDRGIFYMYGNPPAIIEAKFDNGTSVKAYVGENLEIFAIISDEDGCLIRNTKEARKVEIPVIEVLPQISTVMDVEKIIKKVTVDGNKATRLASRNFRNQLFYYNDAFPMFRNLVETTWEGLKVSSIETTRINDGQILQFYVRVNNFEAEIAWMGHGLQMWIQTMWFVSQCSSNSIVVLDEPDVYMHADLQRRLVRLILPMFSQLLIATHSLEIIEEVTSDCIIPIDSSKTIIKPIGDEMPLQLLSKHLGSTFNIDLARIFISNQFIFWDGDDNSRKILSAFQSVLYPQDLHPLINLPKTFINGWDDWEKVTMLADLFNSNSMNMELFCVLNSEYHSLNEIKRLKIEANKYKINLHIWEKKEIENYAISRDAILKYILNNKRKGVISARKLNNVMNGIAKDMKDNLLQYTSKTLNKSICEIYQGNDNSFDIISGKEFFNILSIWTQEEFNITISARQVITYFLNEEVPSEIRNVINTIMRDCI